MKLTDYMYKGRGLTSIEYSVDALKQRLENYIEKYGGELITGTRKYIDNTKTNRIRIIRKQKWEEKQLYRCFKQRKQENLDVVKKKGGWLIGCLGFMAY